MVKEAVEEDLAEGYRDIDARELQKICQNEVMLTVDVKKVGFAVFETHEL